MWALERILFYMAAMTYLLVGAFAHDEAYQRFLQDHIDNPKTELENTDYCELMMSSRTTIQSCKPFNVFIHASEAEIQNVCGAGGYFYHGTRKRRSRKLYSVTVCKLGLMTHNRQCIYYTAFGTKHIVVSCNERHLPVHLDEALTMSK